MSDLHRGRRHRTQASGIRSIEGRPIVVARTPAAERAAAQRAVEALDAAPRDHPFSVYVTRVRGRLAERGLPVWATNVPLYLLDGGVHAGQVVRAAVGKDALGRGADARLLDDGSVDEELELVPASVELSELIDDSARASLRLLHDRAEAIARVARTHQESGVPLLAAFGMSWGSSPGEEGRTIVERLRRSGPGCRAQRELQLLLGGNATLDHPDDLVTAEALCARMVHARLQAEHLEAFTSARARLAGTVRAAREARLLPMISAGNAGDRPYARHAPALLRGFDDGVRGLVKVAADKARLHDDDDVTASFSSPGDAVIAAPGEGIPVEVPPLGRTPQDVDGTSFSTAFVAGVIALMTKASPALTADEAELMLRATARNRTGAGKVGSVDPVAAVEAAWFRAATRRALFGARRSEGSGPVRE